MTVKKAKPGIQNGLPKIGAPATRALAAVGITTLKQVSLWREEDLAELHGMGPKALGILKKVLEENGLSFKSSEVSSSKVSSSKVSSSKVSSSKVSSSKVSSSKVSSSKVSSSKNTSSKLTDVEQVEAFMGKLKHPLKAEIEAVRAIIKGNKKISERVKWNAPSYYYKEDLVTFNPRADKHVHLVFHHPHIVKIKSPLLEGDYKDRRMTYFTDMKAVRAGKKELERIVGELVKMLDK
jgi:hypothetical protein